MEKTDTVLTERQQAVALPELPRSHLVGAVIAGYIAFLIAYLAALLLILPLLNQLTRPFTTDEWFDIAGYVVAAVLFLPQGFGQWFVLRPWVRNGWVWILFCLVVFGAYLWMASALGTLITDMTPPGWGDFFNVIVSASYFCLYGLINGLLQSLLLRSHKWAWLAANALGWALFSVLIYLSRDAIVLLFYAH